MGRRTGPSRAVFLDRDGTLGGEGGYCHPDAFALYEQAFEAVRLLGATGYKVICITNQVRIGLGEITLGQVEESFRRLQRELISHRAHLDGWYVCPHRPEERCLCRKPSPHLLQRAAADFGLDLHRSYMVGDGGSTDMLAGAAAGCKTILVLTGWGVGSLGEFRHLWSQVAPEYVAVDVLDAARFIASREGG